MESIMENNAPLSQPNIINLNVMLGLGILARNTSLDDMLAVYKGLTPDDVEACLILAGNSMQQPFSTPLLQEMMVSATS
jgi:hypothetical protein